MWYLVLLVPPKIFISTSGKAIFFFLLPVGHPAGLNGFVNGCIDLTYVEGLIDHIRTHWPHKDSLTNIRISYIHVHVCYIIFIDWPNIILTVSTLLVVQSMQNIFQSDLWIRVLYRSKEYFACQNTISCKSFSGCHYSIGPMPLTTAQVGMEFLPVTAVGTGGPMLLV